MIRVCLVYREQRPGGFSIEEVFKCIKQQLESEIEFVEYQVDPSRSRWANIRAVGKVNADVYHITGDCNYMALGLPGNKTVLTVHDIGHYEKVLKGVRRFLYGLLWWWLPLSRVDRITVVSKFTLERLHSVFKVPLSKMQVLYNPLFPGFEPTARTFHSGRPRILQIGSGYNKNLDRLIEAVKGIDCELVLINRLSAEKETQLKNLGIRYEVHPKLTQTEVQQIYRSVDLLFFASTYEGFGLPIIEAYATGIPVITSKVASMPEVAKDAAILVDPFSVEEIREAVLRLISDEGLRKELIENGFRRAAEFAPAAIAKQYLDIYKSYAPDYKKVIFLTNIVAPYRVVLFNELEAVRCDLPFDFQVFFMRITESNRKWDIDLNELTFKYRIGNGFYLNAGLMFFHFNPLLIKACIKSRQEIVLGASWNNLNALTLVMLKRLGLISNKLSVWSEANYLTNTSQTRNRLRDLLRKWFFKGIDGSFIVPGHMAVISFEKWKIDVAKFIYLPNLISKERFKALKLKDHNADGRLPVFLLVARLKEKDKGILNFLQAVGPEYLRKVELRIAGSGPSLNAYQEYVRDHSLQRHVQFLGNLSQDQISEQYREADVFLLPSFSDPSPLTVVEAIHSGLPLLISERCGNHYEALRVGENGYTFDPYHKKDVQQKFLKMLDEQSRWNDFAARSVAIANDSFNNRRILRELAERLMQSV